MSCLLFVLLLASLGMKRVSCSVWSCSEGSPFCLQPSYFSLTPATQDMRPTLTSIVKAILSFLSYYEANFSKWSSSSFLLPPCAPQTCSLIISGSTGVFNCHIGHSPKPFCLYFPPPPLNAAVRFISHHHHCQCLDLISLLLLLLLLPLRKDAPKSLNIL